MRVARIAYRIVEIEVDEDKLDTLAGVSSRSQGDVALDICRVHRRIAWRHDGAVPTCRRADYVQVTFAVCWTKHAATSNDHHCANVIITILVAKVTNHCAGTVQIRVRKRDKKREET